MVGGGCLILVQLINRDTCISLTGSIAPQDATNKECGLHSGNIIQSAAEQGTEETLQDLWRSGAVEALTRQELTQMLSDPRHPDTLVVLYAPWCQYSQAMEASYSALADRYVGKEARIAKFQADTDREFAQREFGLQTFPRIVLLRKGAIGYIVYPSERRDTNTLDMWLKSMVGGEGDYSI